MQIIRNINFIVALVLFGTAGCASSPYGSGPARVVVSLQFANSSIQTSASQPFTATVQNASNTKVTWQVNGVVGGDPIHGTISATGVYVAPGGVPNPSIITITAIAQADSTKSASAQITITAAPVVSIALSLTTSNVQVTKQQGFTANVTNDTQNKGVTWSLSGAGCSLNTCGTLSASSSASGVAITYTAPAAVPSPAAVTLTATSVADGTKTASAIITVTAAPVITVSVSPTPTTVQASGGTKNFTATVTNDAQNKGVSWSLSGAGCTGATCGTLSASASASGTPITYTAPTNVPSPALVTLTATSVSDGTKFASAAITVTAVPVITVVVAPSSANVQAPGGTQPFAATVTNDAQNRGVTWTLSGAGCTDNACGTLSSASSASGVAITYTAPSSVPSPALVTLSAKSVSDASKSAAAAITLTAVVVGNISVSISPKRGGLTESQTLPLTATVTNDVASAGVTWSVTGGGIFSNATTTTASYTAPNSPGVVTVTATSVADGSKSASATIGVTNLAGVLTYHNDQSRDGVNAQEYALTTSNVTNATFGKLFSCSVDGAVYAQPLWIPNLTINTAKHNVVFVATTHDTVYAFDADASPCQTLWSKSLLGSGETWVSDGDVGTGDVQPDVGIIGTPVIDSAAKLLYVVAKSKNIGTNCTPAASCHQRLHALSLVDSSEAVGPTALTAAITVPGIGDGSSGGVVPFNTLREHQRPGLVLSNGVVYAAFASHGDNSPYHGWVLGFDKTTLQLVSTFNANPNGNHCGIWMSGGAPSVDAGGNLYFLTGNGTFDANTGGKDYGDSTVKLSTSPGLAVAGYFTPADQQGLEGGDTDHGSGGAAILVDQPAGSPHLHLMIGGGKEGNLFLLDRDNLGGYGANFIPADSNAIQKFGVGSEIFATAAFWNNSLYIAGTNGPLKAFAFNTSTGLFNTAVSSQASATFGFPGSSPSVSSTGAANGIVWALDSHKYCTQQSAGCSSAVLHAYDASNLATELWNSAATAGNAVKFTVPTIANGKVYVGTRGNNTGGAANTTSTPGELDVYGLLPN